MTVCESLAVDVQVAAFPKQNGSRPRNVVFTQGKDPTIVAHEGKVRGCLCLLVINMQSFPLVIVLAVHKWCLLPLPPCSILCLSCVEEAK